MTPAGDTSTLVQNGDNTYTQTLKDGTKINFSSAGYQISVVDRNSNTTSFAYNGSNKLTTVTDLNSQVVTLAYSGGGNLTSVTDPANRITTLAYDGSGRLTSIKDPDATLWTYAYDSSNSPGQRGQCLQIIACLRIADKMVFAGSMKGTIIAFTAMSERLWRAGHAHFNSARRRVTTS